MNREVTNTDLQCVDGATRYRWVGRLRDREIVVEGFRVGDFMVRRSHENERFRNPSGCVIAAPWAVEHFQTGACMVAPTESSAWFLADEMAILLDGYTDIAELAEAFQPYSDWLDEVDPERPEKWRHWCARQRREDAEARAVLGLDDDAQQESFGPGHR